MIAKIVRGSGFRGALNYALNEGKKSIDGKIAVVIGGNMPDTTAKKLTADFKICQRLRPDIAKPVWTESLRAAGGDIFTADQWNDIAYSHLKNIGFDPDTHMYVVVQHPQDNHIHIVANRIGIDGNLYLGRNENLIASKDCRRIEKEYALQPLPEKANQKKHLTKPEIEMSKRTGKNPPRLKLQKIIDATLADRPTAEGFEKRLTAAGVNFKKSSNGYSYELDGIPFKGSQLGKNYSWTQIQKQLRTPEQAAADTLKTERATATAEARAIAAARTAAWTAEQTRRTKYRANRSIAHSICQISYSILPRPMGEVVRFAAELIALGAQVNSWMHARSYAAAMETLKLQAEKSRFDRDHIAMNELAAKLERLDRQSAAETDPIKRDKIDADHRATYYKLEELREKYPLQVQTINLSFDVTISSVVVPDSPAQREERPLRPVKEANPPIPKPAFDFPAMTPEQLDQYNTFAAQSGMTTDDAAKLCLSSYAISAWGRQNDKGTLSNEKYNDLTNQQEYIVTQLHPDAKISYVLGEPSITLNGVSVPEIPAAAFKRAVIQKPTSQTQTQIQTGGRK